MKKVRSSLNLNLDLSLACLSLRTRYLTEKSNQPIRHTTRSGFRSRLVSAVRPVSEGCPHGSRRRATGDWLRAAGSRFALTHSLTTRPLTARPSRRRLVDRSVSDHRRPLSAQTKTSSDPLSTASPERSEGMRSSRPGVRLCGPRLAWLLGLVLLVGLAACGSPSPDGPVSGHTTGSAAAVVSPPVADAPRAGLAAPHAPSPDTWSTDASRATSSGRDTRVPPATASADTPPPPAAQTPAEQAQREAREQWFTELRESPDATVRLQALETWAQQPGDTIDPLTFALVDEDEDVRARAEELYEQQLAREETVP